MGALEIITIFFVVLKLIGVIDWSWLLVFLPSIVSVLLYLITIMLFGINATKIKRDVFK